MEKFDTLNMINGDIGIRPAFYITISLLKLKDGRGTQYKPYIIE